MVAATVSVLLVACDESAPPAPAASPGPPASAFIGPRWSAIAVRGEAPVPGAEPTMTFGETQVQGTGGCNQFSGTYRYDAATGTIAFGSLAMTAMGCIDNRINAIESHFAEVIGRATRLDLDADGRLHVSGPSGEVILAKMVEG
jgi:heat shock protein HslJ